MERLVLDTSAYSWMRAGHGAVLELVASAGVVLVPTIVIGELEAGFALGSRREQNRASLRQFLAEPFVNAVPITPSIGQRYGELIAQLRRAGKPIPTNDVWIAASALELVGHLLTFDRDYERVAGLALTILHPSST